MTDILEVKQDQIVYVNESDNIVHVITISAQGPVGSTGAAGPQGDQGDPGEGVPVGGSAGQVLSKIDGTNFNTEWVTPDTVITDHTALSNIGTNTHAQIDTHIADSTVHFTQAAISITESQISDLQNYALDSDLTNHTGNTSNPHSVTADQVLPDQTGNSGKYLTTNGTTASWAATPAGVTEAQAEEIAVAMAIALN